MIQELKAKLESEKVARRLAIIQELSQVEKDRDTLASQLSQAKQDKDAVVNLSKAELTNALQKTEAHKAVAVQTLKAKLDAIETEKKLAINQAVNYVEKDRDELKINLMREFFITMITLLRNAALNSMKYKTGLALVKAQNIDITNFETELESF